jgi:iron complex outermembrane recepter protein
MNIRYQYAGALCVSMMLASGWAAAASDAAVTADAADAEGGNQLQEIMVTAQKREERINDVGISITAATGDQLGERGITNLAELTALVPSLQFASSQNGTPVYSIRGVGYYESSIAAAPAVSVYQDEVAYTFPVMTKGALLDVARVEVLEGPQGTLYGQNATGGAINFAANQPTKTFAAGADATWGRFNDTLLSGFVSGPLAETLTGRLAFSVEQGGAWQTSDTRDDTLGNKDIKIARLLLNWEPSDKLKVGLNLNGWTDNSDSQANQLEGFRFLDPQFISSPALVPGGTNNPAFYRPVQPYTQYPAGIQALLANTVAPANDRAADWIAGTHPALDESFYQSTVRVDYSASDAFEITSLTTFEKYTQSDQHDYSGLNAPSVSGVVSGDVRTVSQELRLHGVVAGGKLAWLWGANYEGTRTSEGQNYSPYVSSASYLTGGSPESLLPIAPFGNFSASTENSIRTLSTFGNLQYQVLDTLDVHGGIRYTQSHQNANSCSNIDDAGFALFEGATQGALNGTAPATVSPTECDIFRGTPGNETLGPVSTKLYQNNVPWRVGVDWKPTVDNLVYVSVSKGYKAGGVSTIAVTTAVEAAPVTQESLLAYEVGAKSTLLDHSLQLNVAAFHYDYKNKQLLGRILDPTGIFGALEALVNIPQSREDGAEWSVLWEPVRGLTFNAAGTYVESKVTSSFVDYAPYITGPADTVNFKGESFPFTPKWSVNYGVGYRWPIGSDLTAFVHANASYQSSTVAAFGAAQAAAEGPGFGIKGYNLLDLDAGIETKDGHWRGQLWGKNVTNTYYWNNVFNFEDETVRTTGMPATYGITVNYRY